MNMNSISADETREVQDRCHDGITKEIFGLIRREYCEKVLSEKLSDEERYKCEQALFFLANPRGTGLLTEYMKKGALKKDEYIELSSILAFPDDNQLAGLYRRVMLKDYSITHEEFSRWAGNFHFPQNKECAQLLKRDILMGKGIEYSPLSSEERVKLAQEKEHILRYQELQEKEKTGLITAEQSAEIKELECNGIKNANILGRELGDQLVKDYHKLLNKPDIHYDICAALLMFEELSEIDEIDKKVIDRLRKKRELQRV